MNPNCNALVGRALRFAAPLVLCPAWAAVPATAQQPNPPPEVREYLDYFLGRWESNTTIFRQDGSVARESREEFGEVVLLDNHLNLHTSYNPDGTQNKAFRFYNAAEERFYLVDVTFDGSLWVLSGTGDGNVMTTPDRQLPNGRTLSLRFTHSNIQDWSFEAVMDMSFDGGETWTKRSQQSYRRLSRNAAYEVGKSDVSEASFRRMVDYLSDGSGRWRAPNDRHDAANENSVEAVGLWFEESVDGKLLELTVVGHLGSGEMRTGTRGFWFLDPAQEHVAYYEISPNGAVRTGTTAFENDSTFVTTTSAVSPDGSSELNRGVNVIRTDSQHWTAVYTLDPEGNWVEQQALTWTREPDGR